MFLLALLCCGSPHATPTPSDASEVRQNILILIADDLGIDKVSAYHEHPQTPLTPNIDRLAEEGLLLRNAYTLPLCSPTRAAILTGRLPRRHGLGAIVDVDTQFWLSPEVPSLARLVGSALDTSFA